MQDSYALLAPGPVNLHPKVRELLSAPMLHHRTPEFDKILARTLQNIKKIFQTEQSVYLISCTGSGGMEALLVNTCSPGDKIIAINSGKFGERWAEMARVFGLNVIEEKVNWGSAVEVKRVEELLSQHPDTRAVLCQACETSTAVRHPIEKIAQLTKPLPNTLLLVDAITALGAYSIPMDAWGVDGLVGGSQKAFMLPTGMSFVSFSQKAWGFVKTAKLPRFYFDVREEDKANKKGETWFSSNVAIIRALDWVLSDIFSKGLPKHFAEIERRAAMTRHFGERLGFKLYSQAPAASVTALQVPEGIDSQKVRTQLEQEKNITIMGGQDQLKGKVLRVGHMGYITDDDMLRLFVGLKELVPQISDISVEQVKIEFAKWQKENPC